MKKCRKIALILIISSFLGSLYAYFYLPTQVNLRINENNPVSRNIIIFISFVPALVYYSTLLVTLFDKRTKTADNQRFIELISMLSLISAIIANWGVILIAYNFKINMDLVASTMIGLLFIIAGNYLGKLDANSVMGIRNKWTLSNNIIWKSVHRFSGYFFVISGLALILSAIVAGFKGFFAIIPILVVDVLAINIYSYHKYKQISKS